MKYQSNAKINLGLKILDKRDDGYHNLESVFIEIDFHDNLTFTKSSNFNISSNVETIPLNNNNVVYKAYYLMKEIAKPSCDYSIFIDKNIPVGSGLGGGSSNAASTLKILNKLWEINCSNSTLVDLSKSIGSDVPFFIDGGVQFVEGRGDELSQQQSSNLEKSIFVLVFPNFSVDTKWAFNKYDTEKNILHDNNTINKFPSLSNAIDWKFFNNDFEEIINQTYPEISEIKEVLINEGAVFASLSGSGSTMFGVFDSQVKANNAICKFSEYRTVISKPHLM